MKVVCRPVICQPLMREAEGATETAALVSYVVTRRHCIRQGIVLKWLQLNNPRIKEIERLVS
jgi:hypothetical protein